jgi:hypothetical protein
MDVAVIIAAAIGAIPAIIAATKANTGIREIRRVRSMLQAHLTDPRAHHLDARPIRALNSRRERT